MKKLISSCLVLCIISAIVSAFITANAVSENLIVNGGFEDGLKNYSVSTCTAEESSTAHSGDKSVKISNRTQNYSSVQYDAFKEVIQNGAGKYEFSCYARIDGNSSRTVTMYATATPTWTNNTVLGGGKDKNDNYPYKEWIVGDDVTVNTGSWTKLSVQFEIDPIKDLQPLTALSLYPSQRGFSNEDKFDILFDDYSLVKLNDASSNGDAKNVTAPAIPEADSEGAIVHADGKVFANDPNIVYTGRWNKTKYNTVYYSGWQGYVEIKFTGTTKLKAICNYEGTVFGSEAYIDILASNGVSVMPVANKSLSEIGRYAYITDGSDLTLGQAELSADEVYTLRIIARWSYYRVLFQGIQMSPGAKTIPIEKNPKIEFIGDSITEGYVDAKYTFNRNDQTTSNDLRGMTWTDSYSYRTGAMLFWQTSAVGRSAIAIADSSKELMPERYEFLSNVTEEKYDFDNDDLDYIVLNLGTNDRNLSKDAQGREKFKEEYKKFVNRLLELHPHAVIFAVVPFCNKDSYAFGEEIISIAKELERVEYIDTDSWGLSANGEHVKQYLAEDKIHVLPSGGTFVAKKLTEILRKYHDTGKMDYGEEVEIEAIEQVKDKVFNPIWIIVPSAVIVVAVGTIIVVVKKKKQKQNEK